MPLIADHPYVAFYLALSIGFAAGWAVRFMTMGTFREVIADDEVTGIGA